MKKHKNYGTAPIAPASDAVSISINPDDRSPLLPSQADQSGKKKKTSAEIAMEVVTSPFKYLYAFGQDAGQHKIYAAAAFFASAFQAFFAISSNPENVGDEWPKMDVTEQSNTVLRPLSALAVNIPLNLTFLKNATKRFRKLYSTVNHKSIFKLITAMVGSLSSALAAAALAFRSNNKFFSQYIGYYAFIIVLPLAFLTSAVNFASRFLGITQLFLRVTRSSWFNKIAKEQIKATDVLSHIKPHYKLTNEETIKQHLDNIVAEQVAAIRAQDGHPGKLSHDDYEVVLIALMEAVQELDNDTQEASGESIFNDKTRKEAIGHETKSILRVLYGLFFGAFAASVFTEKGYEGLSLLTQLITTLLGYVGHHTDFTLDAFIQNGPVDPDTARRLLGAPAGMASGALYAASAMDFPDLFLHAMHASLVANPSTLLLSFAAQALFNIYAESSMHNATVQALNGSYGTMFGILASTSILRAMTPIVVGTGAAMVNSGPSLRSYVPTDPTYTDIAFQMSTPSHHIITPEHAVSLQAVHSGLSFFGTQKERVLDSNNNSARELDSGSDGENRPGME